MRRCLIRIIILFLFTVLAESELRSTPVMIAGEMPFSEEYTFNSRKIKMRIYYLSGQRRMNSLQLLGDSLSMLLEDDQNNQLQNSDISYYAGISYLLTDNYYNSISLLEKTVSLREELQLYDSIYAKSLYNLGVAYYISGNYDRTRELMLKYIPVGSMIFGETSNDVAVAYIGLISSSISTYNFSDFRDYAFKILDILNRNPGSLEDNELGDLYNNLGVGYFRTRDYIKARLYLEQAEIIYEETGARREGNYISLINNLAGIYKVLKLEDKEKEYYDRGIDLAINDNSSHGINLLSNYAVSLAEAGDVESGRALLDEAQSRARNTYGIESRIFILALFNYSEYLLERVKDPIGAIRNFEICNTYSEANPSDSTFRYTLLTSYSKALLESGQTDLALITNNQIFSSAGKTSNYGSPSNPDIESLIPARSTLDALEVRYRIFQALYTKENKNEYLHLIAETSELAAKLIDRLRLNISEEESRLMLGDNFREIYLRTINDYNNCYQSTGENKYFLKAFEFSERSKVAGLLAATRELKASQFHIPHDVAEFERSLQNKIAFHNFMINGESEKEKPDSVKLRILRTALLGLISQRDSLVLTFEREYPGYFSLKYSSQSLPLKMITRIAGRKTNYLSYVITDSLIYIFIVNKKYQDVVTRSIDTIFFSKLNEFSQILSNPLGSGNARVDFNKFQEAGICLYKQLIEPVKSMLVSDQLLISPDNLLSYLPFESLVTKAYEGSGILYRELDYLLNTYDISYTYSATFMEELISRDYQAEKSLIAFAPAYYKPVNIDSLFLERGYQEAYTFDLPHARIEAERVAGLTRGKLVVGTDARESVFKSEAGKYAVVHLAMHAFLDDLYPMNSAMLFTDIDDRPEDGLLRTYEVYGLPLRAEMIVLSSCNSGSGRLSNGEGILSLARGFLYSGSKSVVMSMWEIEDKSGTEIIINFYGNLLKGMSKSKALKKARREYLAGANQLRSHPYFWSTLVIYGSDDPVFNRLKVYQIIILILVITGAGFFTVYLLKRKYS
jgi:CHAT domain-containing protein